MSHPGTPPWRIIMGLIIGSWMLVGHLPSRRSPPNPERGARATNSHVSDYCRLRTLTTYLHQDVNWPRFKPLTETSLDCPRRMHLYGEFLDALVPYITSYPKESPAVRQRPIPLYRSGNCAHARWKKIFTGAQRAQRLQVLHFVPVGYNLRLLEIMLYELYEAVDYFVLYETDATQIGVRKALMLNASMSRWEPFQDKIIYLHDHVSSFDAHRVLQSVCSGWWPDWTLEHRMRTAAVQKFHAVMHKYPLDSPDRVLVLGSDLDEIATGEAIWHVSHCELKGHRDLNDHLVYFGTLMAKYTLSTLQPIHNARCAAGHQEPWELAACVWGAGPVVKTLRTVMREGSSPRAYPRDIGCRRPLDVSKKVVHMPIGSAIHLSSLSEPTMQLFKQDITKPKEKEAKALP
uniref:Glycosyltransferase family 92 protein n=1 Tax=Eutreptiella gymnastica TaxID=73025 RepID=A0A7S4CWQ3_9EUGL